MFLEAKSPTPRVMFPHAKDLIHILLLASGYSLACRRITPVFMCCFSPSPPLPISLCPSLAPSLLFLVLTCLLVLPPFQALLSHAPLFPYTPLSSAWLLTCALPLPPIHSLVPPHPHSFFISSSIRVKPLPHASILTWSSSNDLVPKKFPYVGARGLVENHLGEGQHNSVYNTLTKFIQEQLVLASKHCHFWLTQCVS